MTTLKIFTTRLYDCEIKRLEKIAKKQGVPKTELARTLISRGLDRIDIAEQKTK
jgi:hypothetical protein